MISLKQKVEICQSLRLLSSQAVAKTVHQAKNQSEAEFRDQLVGNLHANNTYPEGWYAPPPQGVAVLFGSDNDPGRLVFDSLRKPEFWPQPDVIRSHDGFELVHVSPVDLQTGVIGDFGVTTYQGQRSEVQGHMQHSVTLLDDICALAEVGMTFNELYASARKLVARSGLRMDRMKMVNHAEIDISFGHTFPWTYENATAEELKIIGDQDLDLLRDVISKKRIYISEGVEFVIPETIAFSIEARLENPNDPSLPNAYFHYVVTFIGGKKSVVAGFKPAFEAAGMDWIRSRY